MERVLENRSHRTFVQKMATLFPDRAVQESGNIFPWGIYSLMSDALDGKLETASVLLERLASTKPLQTTTKK